MAEETLLRRVAETIREHRLVEPGSTVLVAVSGGADSMALFQALAELRQTLDVTLAVAHLDHQLRAEASRGDAAFVEARAAALDVPFHLEAADVRGLADKEGVSLEMAARAARYGFLRRVAKTHGYAAAATGHTLDDQAETLLLRLARGAGTGGLSGIARSAVVDGIRVIRPLLDVRHETLVSFLKERGLTWREDASNRDLAFLRNRVRHEILPRMRDLLNPRVEEALARAANLLEADERWLEARTADVAPRVWADDDPARIDVHRLAELPLAARRRVVRAWLAGQGVDPDVLDYHVLHRVLGLADSIEGSARVPLPGGGEVERSYGVLALRPGDAPVLAVFDEVLRIPGETLVPEAGLRVVARRRRGRGPASAGPIGTFPATASFRLNRTEEDAVHIRTWRPGDRIVLPGTAGTRKVQDVFTDAKVARLVRRKVPLLVCRDEVIWIPGYQVAGPWHVASSETPAVHLEVESY